MTTPRQTNPLHGIFWMMLTGLLFVAVTALVKQMGDRIPAPQAAFLRYLLGLVFLLPILRSVLAVRPDRRLWAVIGLRGLLHGIGVMLWFFAMTRIPLAEVTAISYVSPVFVTIGAVLFLGERIAVPRILAVCVALIGAAIILRPGFRELNLGHLSMLGQAVVFAGSYMMAKVLADEMSPAIVVAMLSIFVTITLTPFAIAVWVAPMWSEIGMLFLVACFATAGHYTMTLAFRAAPITVTQPATFLQLVWATLLGAAMFGEPVDIWVVVGGAVVLSSVTFITWREARRKRRQITPRYPETKV